MTCFLSIKVEGGEVIKCSGTSERHDLEGSGKVWSYNCSPRVVLWAVVLVIGSERHRQL